MANWLIRQKVGWSPQNLHFLNSDIKQLLVTMWLEVRGNLWFLLTWRFTVVRLQPPPEYNRCPMVHLSSLRVMWQFPYLDCLLRLHTVMLLSVKPELCKGGATTKTPGMGDVNLTAAVRLVTACSGLVSLLALWVEVFHKHSHPTSMTENGFSQQSLVRKCWREAQNNMKTYSMLSSSKYLVTFRKHSSAIFKSSLVILQPASHRKSKGLSGVKHFKTAEVTWHPYLGTSSLFDLRTV